MLTIGIDPGTKSFDVCGIEEKDSSIKVIIDESFPSEEVAKDPSIIIELIEKFKPNLIVAPSGYGIALKHISQLNEVDMKLITLSKKTDEGIPVLKGLTKLIKMFKELNYNAYLIPGVIHLPTVKSYRKINKIDMGTADKLCVAVLGIYDQSRYYRIDHKETNFILVELGYAYNACIAVEKGKIIDGIGGTNASISFKSLGEMDGELAYILGNFEKKVLFSGGISDILQSDNPEDILKDEFASEAFFEGIEKMVSSMLVSLRYPKEILISGRLSRIEGIYEEVRRRLRKYAKVRRIEGLKYVINKGEYFEDKPLLCKEAAQGAALISNGLAGGIFKDLIFNLELYKSKGTILDYIYLKNYKAIIYKNLSLFDTL